MKKRVILLIICSFALCIILLAVLIAAEIPNEVSVKLLIPAIIIILVIGAATVCILLRIVNKFLSPFNQLFNSINNYLKGDEYNFKIDNQFEETNEISDIFEKVSGKLERYKNRARLENKKTSLILDRINEGLLVLDADQDVLMINDKARSILNCTDDVTNINVLHYITNPIILKNIDIAQKKHKNRIFDIFDTESGKAYRYYITMVSQDALGKSGDGMVILIMDVTEIIQAEQVRKDFTSNVNEQMKKPIEKIIDNLSKVKKNTKKGTEQYKLIKKSLNEASSLNGIINDAILITELETLDDDIQKVPVDLRTVSLEFIPYAQGLAEDKNVNVNVSGNATYKANPERMKELIKNLLTNAIKYNKDYGKVDLLLEDTNKEVIIKISDTGAGIAPEEKDRIFERFYRGKEIDKNYEDVPGTGLGLSIVKHIVMLYEGTVDIKSEIGKGTSITVKLPKNKKNA